MQFQRKFNNPIFSIEYVYCIYHKRPQISMRNLKEILVRIHIVYILAIEYVYCINYNPLLARKKNWKKNSEVQKEIQ